MERFCPKPALGKPGVTKMSYYGKFLGYPSAAARHDVSQPIQRETPGTCESESTHEFSVTG